MERYLGVKLIDAEPQVKDGKEGYKVVYPDGYVSWSPKDVFEEAYRRIDGLTFGLAVEAMKKGLKARLPKWGRDVFISIQMPDAESKMTAPYMYATSRFGRVPWNPTQIELLAEDWRIAR